MGLPTALTDLMDYWLDAWAPWIAEGWIEFLGR
jgi:hypothetical protein